MTQAFGGPVVERVRWPATTALDWAAGVFRALGADEETASAVALALVAADLAGHASHGVRLVATYAHQVSVGELVASARPRVIGRDGGHTSLSGGFGLGAGTMRHAVACAAEDARRHGFATVGLSDLGHVGRLGLYVSQLSAQGLIGILTCGSAFVPSERVVAPLGGVERVFDTNPWAFGFPAEGGDVVIDMSTSARSYNAVAALAASGGRLPEGVGQDRHGRPCPDPAEVLRSGSLLPAGGAVGYGLALATACLAALGDGPRAGGVAGGFLVAIDVARRRPVEPYRRHVGEVADALRASAPRSPDLPVRVPGGRGALVRSPAEVSGLIPVDEYVVEQLEETCQRLGLPPVPEPC
ncbi:Ldh family oxidoreductase [Saccharothrix syringae]|uniref:Ldh family oxidoreductase n=1 Tax=Saccharothrix syringae TaxID=103733 RepID=UPI00052535BB|nr:Ldh family oxidoreductase [Saccharothrix syringae]